MKKWNFLIFFCIVFTVYTLINFYIFHHAGQAFPLDEKFRGAFAIIFWLVAYSYLLGRILERIWLSLVSEFFTWLGSFWLGAMVYFFLFVLFIDLIKVFGLILPLSAIPKFNLLKENGFYIACLFASIVVLVGFFNARFPRTHVLDVQILKKSKLDTLKIVVASDIHLGTIVGSKRFYRILAKIEALQPDIILLPGDVVDEDLAPVIKENLGDDLKKLKAKLGVYAITGNHEYIGGVHKAVNYLQQHGIRVLRDEAVLIEGDFYLIGRDDRSVNQFKGRKRKPLAALMQDVNTQKPIILLDHQPFDLNEAVENRVDLQISGHTHHGQLFPMNLITKRIYEKSWGYLKKGDTHFYISSGVGTWGPPIRIGNHPEIVLLNVHFE